MSDLSLKDIKICLNGGKWGQGEAYPRLIINIKSDTRQTDIQSISYVFEPVLGQTFTYSIDDDTINSISTHIDDDKSELVWNEEGGFYITLYHQLNNIIKKWSTSDVTKVASLYSAINQNEFEEYIDPHQKFINVFLTQVSFYLVYCDLLYKGLLWTSLPLTFKLPFYDMTSKILSRSAMQYFRYPIESFKIMGSPFILQLEWILIGFFNIWEDMYINGDDIDLTYMVHDLTLKTSEATLRKMSDMIVTLKIEMRREIFVLKQELMGIRESEISKISSSQTKIFITEDDDEEGGL